MQGWRVACALSQDSKRQQARAVAAPADVHCAASASAADNRLARSPRSCPEPATTQLSTSARKRRNLSEAGLAT
jgi:hypothetical protein